MIDPVFAPAALFFGIFGAVFAIVGIAVTLYALYDVIFRQEEMQTLEKLVWVMVIIFFNLFGVLAYLIVVRMWDTTLIEEANLTEARRLRKLERLTDLRERGALTADEFEEEKQNILGSDE